MKLHKTPPRFTKQQLEAARSMLAEQYAKYQAAKEHAKQMSALANSSHEKSAEAMAAFNKRDIEVSTYVGMLAIARALEAPSEIYRDLEY